jgi:hypothetical protein
MKNNTNELMNDMAKGLKKKAEDERKVKINKYIKLLEEMKHEIHVMSNNHSYDFSEEFSYTDPDKRGFLLALKEVVYALDNAIKELIYQGDPSPPRIEFSSPEDSVKKSFLINSLISLADSLDKDKLTKQANYVDALVKKLLSK